MDTEVERMVIVRVEPSHRLSELCGFPCFIEQRFKVKELLEKNIINADDIREMTRGKEICKKIPIVKEVK